MLAYPRVAELLHAWADWLLSFCGWLAHSAKALTDALSASNKKDLDQSLMVLPEALNTGKH